ncbi:MAG: MauE/DoxX family redox-associated membrane protein [Bryobacteraceae bacterium]
MEILLLVARVLLAATFTVSGVAKLLDRLGSQKSLQDFGVPAFLAGPMAFLLPIAELTCAMALIPNASVQLGAIGVSVLLIVFIFAIGINLARGRKPDCHCFGQLSSKPVGASTLVRNVVLLGFAGVVAWKGPEYPGWGTMGGYTNLETVIFTLIAVLGAGLGLTLFFLFQMLRQNGRLLLRLEAIEKKLDINPDEKPVAGLPVGSEAPYVPLEAAKVLHPFLLVFTESGCGACEALQPELAQWRIDYADRLSIHVISGPETVHLYKATATPSAVLVVDGKVASPLSEGVDAIRKLVTRSTLPPPVKRGDPVPSMQLQDLEGATVDLASLRGRRTLVLFWSPRCG